MLVQVFLSRQFLDLAAQTIENGLVYDIIAIKEALYMYYIFDLL